MQCIFGLCLVFNTKEYVYDVFLVKENTFRHKCKRVYRTWIDLEKVEAFHTSKQIFYLFWYMKNIKIEKKPLLLDKLHLVCISVLTLQYHLHHVHSLEEVLVDHLWSPHLCHTSGILWDHQWYHLDLLVGPICDRIDGLKVRIKRVQIWLIKY